MHNRAANIGLALTVMVSGVLLCQGAATPEARAADLHQTATVSKAASTPNSASVKIHASRAQANQLPGKPASYSDDALEKKINQKAEQKDPLARAKSILREIENIEHPENTIRQGSPGWLEERNAAINSSQQRLQSCQARLTTCGPAISPLLAENLSSANHDVAQTCANVLGQFGEAAVPCLIDLIKTHGPQPMATAALKTIGADALPPLGEMLKSADAGQSLAAITVLNSFMPDQYIGNAFRSSFYRHARFQPNNQEVILPISTVNTLCHLATKDKSVKYREQLISLLGKIGPRAPIVADTVATYVTDEEQPVVREAAVHALGLIAATQNEEAAKKSYEVLIRTLKSDDFEGCRSEAATVLGNLQGEPELVVPALTIAFKDGYPEVSNAALQSLGNYGDRAASAVPTILKFIEDRPDSVPANNALRTVARIKTASPQTVPVIIKMLDGHQTQLQLTAINAVETLGPSAAPAVKSLISLLTSPDGNLRNSAVRALGAIGPQASEAVQPLRELSRARSSERTMVRQTLTKITGADEKDPEASPPSQPAQSAPVTNINTTGGSSI